MEESQYHNIREETMNSMDIHNSIINSINNLREGKDREASYLMEAGKIVSPFLYKEGLEMKMDLGELPAYGEWVEGKVSSDDFKYDLIREVIWN
jgi:hypothetical protein